MRLIVFPQGQGETNGCGTTCLSMAMEFWRPGRSENRRGRIDASIRPFDLFTAPGDMVRYAREHGYAARVLVDAQPRDLALLLGAGVPAIVLIARARGESLHYLLALEHQGSEHEGFRFTFNDPASGSTLVLEDPELEGLWRGVTYRGLPGGVGGVVVAIAPPERVALDALLPVRPLQSAGSVLLGALALKDLAIGVHRRDALRLIAGLVEAIASLPGVLGNLVVGLSGRALRRSGNPLYLGAGLLLSVPGGLLELLGMACSPLGQLAGDLLSHLSRVRRARLREAWSDDPH